ncbi:hypothetical protein WH47_11698 [Habropoda laboriosa]|uniref:Uncharacterized protein n=1 Tax=Habropoda laboriosa TaxID=597456 RepID=A0A0L7R837_9HYME|nr:hypothetical protein WH47_11698 [Habropoda laboriosa]
MFGGIRAAALHQAADEGKCSPCAQQSSCPPCCTPSSPIASKGFKAFSDLLGKETNTKKCGCPVKDYSCNCVSLNFQLTYPHGILLKILIENALTVLQWEAILVRVFLDSNNTVAKILPAVEEEAFPQLKPPEVAISEHCWERIDVRDAEVVKIVEQAGKKGKGKKRKKSDQERKRKEREKRDEEREAEEKERLRKWEECWERKFQAEEERDRAECCSAKGLCGKPRTQSNIWINVTKDRSIQEIHMAFKHVPVPRPKPPPLPPPTRQKAPDSAAVEKRNAQKAGKKSGTTKTRKI